MIFWSKVENLFSFSSHFFFPHLIVRSPGSSKIIHRQTRCIFMQILFEVCTNCFLLYRSMLFIICSFVTWIEKARLRSNQLNKFQLKIIQTKTMHSKTRFSKRKSDWFELLSLNFFENHRVSTKHLKCSSLL